ncbi:uncharacterized protein LOC143859418 [Tasmannia lanceolata]|uniref:uncharacterized protein LOC143859418 n=1 Tax=Tasmannia lanceolata TaxID=3420 RepID=UPI0040638774
MTLQIILRSPASLNSPDLPPRRQPLLSKNSPRFAEVAGGTAAECAAICCCFPCGLLNLLVLAVVKLPAGLCRRALKKKSRKNQRSKSKIALLTPKRSDDSELQIQQTVSADMLLPGMSPVLSDMELEMWAQLYGTGFWRNPSERE